MTWAADLAPQSPAEVLTLDQCLEMAYKNSPSLKTAAKNLEIANLQVWEALGSFMPTVTYQLGANKSNVPSSTLGPEYTAGMIGITEKLYSGGLLSAKYKIAKFNFVNAMEEQRKAKQQITFNVKQAYYQVWQAEQMLEVSKSSLKNAERRYQQQKAYFDVGNASKVELLQAQVQWESMKPQVISNQNLLNAARLNLAIIMGIGKDVPYTINVDLTKFQLPENVTIAFETTLEDAYKNRPDVRVMENTVEIGKLNTKMAWAAVKPTLTLTNNLSGGVPASNGVFDLNPANWPGGITKTWTLSLNLSGVLFDGLASEEKIMEAKKNEELIAIRDSSLKDQVRVEIEQAIQSINANLATARASQSNIDLAKESLRLIQAKFDAGMATTIDITDAQLKLDQALNGYYSGLSAYLTALAKLDLVTGKDI